MLHIMLLRNSGCGQQRANGFEMRPTSLLLLPKHEDMYLLCVVLIRPWYLRAQHAETLSVHQGFPRHAFDGLLWSQCKVLLITL